MIILNLKRKEVEVEVESNGLIFKSARKKVVNRVWRVFRNTF